MKSLQELVRVSLEAQGVTRDPGRLAEISTEATRLLSGLREVSGQLDYYDEPSQHAALLMRERDRG
jgi:hypothetical protein